jgi:hypothetical protein
LFSDFRSFSSLSCFFFRSSSCSSRSLLGLFDFFSSSFLGFLYFRGGSLFGFSCFFLSGFYLCSSLLNGFLGLFCRCFGLSFSLFYSLSFSFSLLEALCKHVSIDFSEMLHGLVAFRKD